MAKKIIFLIPSFFLAVFFVFGAILFFNGEIGKKNKAATAYDTISPYTIIAPTTATTPTTSTSATDSASTSSDSANTVKSPVAPDISSISSTPQITAEPPLSVTATQSEGSATASSEKEPSGVFLHPTGGSTLSGTVEIDFYSEGAQGVEFYVQKKEDYTRIYLGKGALKESFTWYFSWPTEKFPNGNYSLYAKTFDSVNNYNTEEISVNINNAVSNQTQFQIHSQGQTTLTPVSSETPATISPKLIQKLESTTKDEITNNIKNLSAEAEKLASDEKNKKQIKKEFDALSLKITNNLSASGADEIKNSKDGINQTTDNLLNLINNAHGGTGGEKLEIKIKENIQDAVDKVEKIVAEKEEAYSPTVLDKKESPDYKVEKVEMVVSPASDEKTIKIEGIAPPFSYVTIYIYSIPTIVIARADENGKWEYILDKQLANGPHTVYAAVTNDNGEVEKSSAPFSFVKTEDKIVDMLQPDKNSTASPAENLHRIFVILIFATISIALIFVLVAAGIYIKKEKKA